MKQLFIIVFLTTFVYSLPAQTFISRKGDGNCAQMTIRYDGNTVYYHLDKVDGNCADYHMMIINLTAIRIVDKQLTFPDDGQKYWIISFDANEPPSEAERGRSWCVWCRCAWPSQGDCNSFVLNGGYCDGNCYVCDTQWMLCDGAGFRYSNGVVLVQADKVTME